ncbi:MAG TPA: hypothetical protein VHL79_03215 [Ramlibacter sp.]|jgi:hypothetical protein|nr:hypothetical protein [Ramlibacter sp.]
MHRLDNARAAWEQAQSELQAALAELERQVKDTSDPQAIGVAKSTVEKRQRHAEDMLQRYITQLGKS